MVWSAVKCQVEDFQKKLNEKFNQNKTLNQIKIELDNNCSLQCGVNCCQMSSGRFPERRGGNKTSAEKIHVERKVKKEKVLFIFWNILR